MGVVEREVAASEASPVPGALGGGWLLELAPAEARRLVFISSIYQSLDVAAPSEGGGLGDLRQAGTVPGDSQPQL